MRVPLVDAIHVTAMINRLKLFLLCLLMVTCVTDYSVVTNPDIIVTQGTTDKDTSEVKDTEVVVEYFVQPDKPENLDVLFVIDTSCSMSDNFENVSAGLDILRGDIEALTYDYQIAMINSSLREVYFVGPYDTNSTSIDIFMAPYFLARDMFEEPFATLYQFTTTPEGISFLRPNVDKLYIFVSDEPEQSVIPVSMFKDWMDEYHSGVQHDIVIIGINDSSPEDCKQFFNFLKNQCSQMLIF